MNKEETIVEDSNKIVGRNEYYIIKNYNIKDSGTIDRYVEKIRDKMWAKKYTMYTITFYKESEKTNYNTLKQHPTYLHKYSDGQDMVYFYLWAFNKFEGREIFNREKSNIIIEDLEP